MLRQGVSWDPGQRDAALAGRLAARQPDRERLRDPLRILLEGLEERPDLVEEDRLRRKLRLQLRVTSKHGTILRPEPRFVSPKVTRQSGITRRLSPRQRRKQDRTGRRASAVRPSVSRRA